MISRRLLAFKRSSQPGRGFTLVETIVAAGVTLVVMTGATVVFIACAKLQQDIYYHTVLDAEARKVEDWLVSDIRSAVKPVASVTQLGVTYTTSNNGLVLMLPGVAADGSPVDSFAITGTATLNHPDYVVYYNDANGYMHRRLIRDAASRREGTLGGFSDRLLASSSNPNTTFTGSFAQAPTILGTMVIHYEILPTRVNGRRTTANFNPYKLSIAGSAYLRNRAAPANS